jgi:hypothetical protein
LKEKKEKANLKAGRTVGNLLFKITHFVRRLLKGNRKFRLGGFV